MSPLQVAPFVRESALVRDVLVVRRAVVRRLVRVRGVVARRVRV